MRCGKSERVRLRTCLPPQPDGNATFATCGATGPDDFSETESCGSSPTTSRKIPVQ